MSRKFQNAVHRVLSHSALDGASWVPGSDPWLVERLSPIGSTFPRTSSMRSAIVTMRWVQDRWVVAYAKTEPRRQNVVLRAVAMGENEFWEWALPVAKHLVDQGVTEQSEANAIVVEPVADPNPAITLSLLLQLIASATRQKQELSGAEMVHVGGEAGYEARVRLAAAMCQYLQPRSSALVLMAPAAEAEDRAFMNLGWRIVLCPGPASGVGEIEGWTGAVRGVSVADLAADAEARLRTLFLAWGSEGVSANWQERLVIPAVMVPANLLAEAEWQDRLRTYRSGAPAAGRWEWDLACLTGTPQNLERCVDLYNLERELTAGARLVEERLLELCGTSSSEIKELCEKLA